MLNERTFAARWIGAGRRGLSRPAAGAFLTLLLFIWPAVDHGATLLAGPAAAADEARLFTPHVVAALRGVGDAVMAPDGRHVAYSLSVPRRPGKDENGPAWTELHVVDLQGRSRPMVAGKVSVSDVGWTPDGRGVSFLLKRGDDKHKSLYVIPLDGGEARKVLAHDEDIDSYSWRPDGRRVAFRAKERQDAARKKLRDKGFNAKVYEEDWRPTWVWIAEIEMDDMELPASSQPSASLASGAAARSEPRKLSLTGSSHAVEWSPAGEHLMVTLAPTPLVDDSYMKTDVYVVDAETGETVREIDVPGKLGPVAWSPDGQRLAVIAGADIHDPSPGRLMAPSIEDARMRELLPDFDGHIRHAGWQDADTVMYVADTHTFTQFGKVDIDGGQMKVLIPAGGPILESLSMADDGMSAAFVADSPAHPREVYVMAHGDSGPRRLTYSNPGLDELRFAKQEVIEFPTRDGLTLEGILIRPLDEQPGTRYPLIMVVHGGPESHYANGWVTSYSNPGQVGAARGFAVFYPNYRGGTGRGVEHSKLGQADYGGKEFDDLVDAIDHLVKMRLVDRAKVGVTGGSYGGYASAWCATKLTEHFAASVMMVGLSDLTSKAGTTDIPHEMHLVHGRKWPWDDWDWYRERSPIYYAAQARTPILICHGEDDTRVHPSQSLELYRFLKLHGNVPVRLVLYPGEGHGNRNAASRLDYQLRQLRWMEHYLKGPGGEPPPYELDCGVDLKDEDRQDATSEADSPDSEQ